MSPGEALRRGGLPLSPGRLPRGQNRIQQDNPNASRYLAHHGSARRCWHLDICPGDSPPRRHRQPSSPKACLPAQPACSRLRERVIHLLHVFVLLEFVDQFHDFGRLLFG